MQKFGTDYLIRVEIVRYLPCLLVNKSVGGSLLVLDFCDAVSVVSVEKTQLDCARTFFRLKLCHRVSAKQH